MFVVTADLTAPVTNNDVVTLLVEKLALGTLDSTSNTVRAVVANERSVSSHVVGGLLCVVTLPEGQYILITCPVSVDLYLGRTHRAPPDCRVIGAANLATAAWTHR